MYALIFFTAFGLNAATVFTIQGIPSKSACVQMGKELQSEVQDQVGSFLTPEGKFICKAIPTK